MSNDRTPSTSSSSPSKRHERALAWFVAQWEMGPQSRGDYATHVGVLVALIALVYGIRQLLPAWDILVSLLLLLVPLFYAGWFLGWVGGILGGAAIAASVLYSIEPLLQLPVTAIIMTFGGLIGWVSILLRELQSELRESQALAEQLRGNQQLLESIFSAHPLLIFLYDLNTFRVLRQNQGLTTILGYPPDAVGSNIVGFLDRNMHADDAAQFDDYFDRLRQAHDDQVFDSEFRVIDANGHWRWLHSREVVFGRDARGVPNQALAVVEDITDRKTAELRLAYMSTHDALTGVYNRAHFDERIDHYRHHPELFPVGIIVADIDGLKRTNDTWGHEAGDVVIRHAASVFGLELPGSARLFRTGGDEFIMLLPRTDSVALEAMVQQLREAVDRERDRNEPIELSVSLGSATATNGAVLQRALRNADEAMYVVKAARYEARHSATD